MKRVQSQTCEASKQTEANEAHVDRQMTNSFSRAGAGSKQKQVKGKERREESRV